jgi:uncharacterized protein (UPF0248 family)
MQASHAKKAFVISGGLTGVSVTYAHRGTPGNQHTICAEEITAMGHSFLSIDDSMIPYYRIARIEKDDKVLFDIEYFKRKY